MALYSTLLKPQWIDTVFTMHQNSASNMIIFLHAVMDEADSPEFVLPKILRLKNPMCLEKVSTWQNKKKSGVKLSSTETLSLLEAI